MDYKHIPALLERYFEGNTTLEEEAQLRAYFQQEDIPAALAPYRPLFQYFAEAKEYGLPANFDQKVMEQLPKPSIHRLRSTWWVRAAALVGLALGAWWAVEQYAIPPQEEVAIDWSKYEPETVEEALEITRSAFLKVSTELNQGASKAASQVDKAFNLGQ